MTHFATVSSLELFKLWSLLVISFNVFSTPAASREDSWRAYGQSKKNGSLPPRMSVPHPAQFNTDPGADMGRKVPGIVEQWPPKPSVELGLATPDDCLTRDAEPAEEVAWPGGGHTGEGCLPLWFYRWRQHAVGSGVGERHCTVPYNRPRSVVAQRPELIMYPTWVTVIQNQCVITILGGSISWHAVKERLHWPVGMICSSGHPPGIRAWPWGPGHDCQGPSHGHSRKMLSEVTLELLSVTSPSHPYLGLPFLRGL